MVSGGPDTDTTLAALAAFGLEPETPLDRQVCEIWPENWLPVKVFSRMTSQLIVGGMGGVIGIQYGSIPVVMRGLQLSAAERAEVWDVFQIMEQHMVQILNKKMS